MGNGVRRALTTALAVGLAAATLVGCNPPPPPPPVDIYAFAGRCYVLKDETSGRFVARDLLGYHANAPRSGATPFHMQATALGRYLFYGPGGQMPQVGLLNTISSTTTPGVPADWKVATRNGRLSFTSLSNGQALTVTSGGRLGQSVVVQPRWSLVTATGCTPFPEIEVNATGTPFKGSSPTAPVRGFLDSHTHVSGFQFLGTRFHCGRPWSPYGVTVALQDCPDHEPNGAAAVAENLLATGAPVGTHSTDGWPTFAGWPRPESLTHEGTYWKWIERAWRGGLRIMVNDLVENRALCEIYPLTPPGQDCNEMNSVRRQARDMFALQDYIDAQYRGPNKGFFRIVGSPAEARRVINEGKLAVVLGVEISEVLDCGRRGATPLCDEEQIDIQLDELHGLGVRSLFPVHKFDNALGGTAFDDGATGLLVNTGNKYATGEWWDAQPCAPGAETDHRPTDLAGNQALLYAVFGQAVAPLLNGDLPAYPPGPLCNPKGLTSLGVYVVNALADRGMIIETDHMSVKARNETLTILESRDYSGLITSHSWGDGTSQQRLQRLGGVVAPYARTSPTYVESWQAARASAPPGYLFGIGYGSDTNGLGAQPSPRPGAGANPVTYPYRTFDGGTLMDRQRSGTRVYDINSDGAPHYGLFPDYIEDLRQIAGDQIVADMAKGAEAYLQMWQRADAARTR
jgi:microsomal dipeptidase-like Zn-dependent dipeptidase